MFGKDFWFGKEVEGRFSDVETVFVRKTIPNSFKDFPHVYFTIEYAKDCKDNNEWSSVLNLIDSKQIITIEVNSEVLDSLPVPLFQRCHLIYRIQDSNFERLKETDTLSIDAGWYRVYQITKLNMQEIKPDNYKFDYV